MLLQLLHLELNMLLLSQRLLQVQHVITHTHAGNAAVPAVLSCTRLGPLLIPCRVSTCRLWSCSSHCRQHPPDWRIIRALLAQPLSALLRATGSIN